MKSFRSLYNVKKNSFKQNNFFYSSSLKFIFNFYHAKCRFFSIYFKNRLIYYQSYLLENSQTN